MDPGTKILQNPKKTYEVIKKYCLFKILNFFPYRIFSMGSPRFQEGNRSASFWSPGFGCFIFHDADYSPIIGRLLSAVEASILEENSNSTNNIILLLSILEIN